MAITTLDGVIAGFQPVKVFYKSATGTLVAGRPVSLWSFGGVPGPGGFDTTLDGVALSAAVSGQIPFTNPVSGNSYLAKFSGQTTQAGTLLLCDRIWHNGGFNVSAATSVQAVSSPTWPTRDANGAANGEQVIVGLEVQSTTGTGTPTLSLGYTNTSASSGKTGTNINATVATSPAGSFYPIGLQAGDTGVQSIQSLTLSATWTSGAIGLVAYRVLAQVELGAQIPATLDALTAGLPRIYDGSVLFLIFIPNTTTSTLATGSVIVTQG